MSFYTLAQIKQKIQQPLDLEEEIFIRPEELLEFINDAIREAEAIILDLSEDYFLTKVNIPLTAGVSEYTLPADIYGSKIRGLVYDDGSTTHQVKRIRRFTEIPWLDNYTQYRFLLTNDATNGVKMTLYPAAQITSSTALTCYYIRNAKQLVNDTDVCDIPEFVSYIIQHAKVSCMQKEGNPLLMDAQAKLDKLTDLMEATLKDKIIDEDNTITMDLTSYEEST